MILTAKQVEALDVGTTMGRLADLKNLLFIMDSWMTARGKADESDQTIEVDCGHMGFAYAPAAVDTVIGCLMELEAAQDL